MPSIALPCALIDPVGDAGRRGEGWGGAPGGTPRALQVLCAGRAVQKGKVVVEALPQGADGCNHGRVAVIAHPWGARDDGEKADGRWGTLYGSVWHSCPKRVGTTGAAPALPTIAQWLRAPDANQEVRVGIPLVKRRKSAPRLHRKVPNPLRPQGRTEAPEARKAEGVAALKDSRGLAAPSLSAGRGVE